MCSLQHLIIWQMNFLRKLVKLCHNLKEINWMMFTGAALIHDIHLLQLLYFHLNQITLLVLLEHSLHDFVVIGKDFIPEFLSTHYQ